MTNDKTVTMSLELIKQAADRLSDLGQSHISEPMFAALLAAPVVERQEPKGALIRSREYVGIGQGGRELWHDWSEWLHTTVAHAQSKIEQTKDLSSIQFEVEWLYTSPPAPVAVALPDVDELAQIIRMVDGNHSLGAGALAERILDKVKELNQ